MNAKTAGFTLIELLIAMLLITLALTISFAALRLGTRSLERTDRLADTLEELRVTRIVVQRHLAQARPLLEMTTDPHVSFRGEAQKLEFVAPAPTQGERLAGLYQYRLHFERGAQGEQLLLDYQPYAPGPLRSWPPQPETALLLDHIEAGAFSYYNAAPEEAEWLDLWHDNEHLPRMVRVTLARNTAPGERMEMVVMLPTERAR
ncbi:MAG TPA: prepilin-type N-terminal cleavage/methylation domain-containing protein [Gammaproteobacteria bacterium]